MDLLLERWQVLPRRRINPMILSIDYDQDYCILVSSSAFVTMKKQPTQAGIK